jgi:hypothetical protein
VWEGGNLKMEAVLVLINKIVKKSGTGNFVVNLDRAISVVFGALATAAACYVVAYEKAFVLDIPQQDFDFLLVTLVTSFWVLGFGLSSKLVGRWSTNDRSEQLKETREEKLPFLLFNFESFPRSCRGRLAGFICVSLFVVDSAASVVLVYAAIAHIAAQDSLSRTFEIAWACFLFRNLLNATARCADFSELMSQHGRHRRSTAVALATPSESLRLALVTLHVFVTVNILFPLGIFLFVYARV